MDLEDTWSPARVFLAVRKMVSIQVSVEPEGKVPDEGKDQPGKQAQDEEHHHVLQEVPLGYNANRVGPKVREVLTFTRPSFSTIRFLCADIFTQQILEV